VGRRRYAILHIILSVVLFASLVGVFLESGAGTA
jgi:hypothetical protein